MSELRDRMAQLTAEQRALLEKRLRTRGIEAPGETRAEDAEPAAIELDPEAWRARAATRGIDLGIYLFSDDGGREGAGKYELALQAARFADREGFVAVWTPERHFQPFGGLYPNPSVLGAALAVVTERIGIRAGSVALPLHHPLRVAEEWAVVDNLSNGRAGISVASGWHPDDFILTKTLFDERKEAMFRGVEIVRRLWAGEAVRFEGQNGEPLELKSLPRPIQATLPIWVTSAGNPETWERAGEVGANVLAALVGYTSEDLAALIARYRAARERSGHDPESGKVSLVVHTFVGASDREVRTLVREPMTRYLKTYLAQFAKLGLAAAGGSDRDARDVAAMAFEHYYETSTLLGTQSKCARVLDEVAASGADELACLIDFGLERERVLAALPRLAELRHHFARREERAAGAAAH
ncbi:MAG: MupA/Atu3671 family FMN-dependent luciferase-like monooxygenase [Candidatus Eisenbacteria bacterium]